MRGRKPKPTNLKLIQGNPGQRPLNDAEPQPKNEMPKCPAHLTPEAAYHWEAIAPMLHRCGLLTELDGDALAAYCESYSRWVDAKEKIGKEPMMMTPNGFPVMSPYWTVARQCHDQMLKLLAEFGMSPSSRSRIKVNVKTRSDSKAEKARRLLNKG